MTIRGYAVKAERVQNDPLRHIQLQCMADEIGGMVGTLIEAESMMEAESKNPIFK
jgi:hypothetical protein